MDTQEGMFRPEKRLLTAWLLLIISEGPTYGYKMRTRLESYKLDIDPSQMYRALQDLDNGGFVRSSWVSSEKGPRQHQYSITKRGREHLESLKESIMAARYRHDAFLKVYEDRTTA